MSELELTPEIFTADYFGEPGRRTFFLQARSGETTHSFAVEKQQVALLAEKLREVLLMVDEADTIKSATSARDPALELADPDPQWRVGDMGLAYDEETEQVVVLLEEIRIVDDESALDEVDATDVSDAGAARILLRRDQARAFALHALAIVAEGRPICQLCGLPMDPAGHKCPASNGHHVETPRM